MTTPAGILLDVRGIHPREVGYNPAVIIEGRQKIIAVRVEHVDSDWHFPDHYDPHIMFFRHAGNTLKLIPDMPIFSGYEDPWATWITGPDGSLQLLFGAVWVDYSTSPPTITTRLFLAAHASQLDPFTPFAEIRDMKDIRICQLPGGPLAVLTRPTLEGFYFGRIGYAQINNIYDVNTGVANAKLLNFDISNQVKIGSNEAYFENGHIHVYSHAATTDEAGDLHYTAYQFDFDPADPFTRDIHLSKICERADFPVNNGLTKGKYFEDVIFPGGTGGPGQTDYYCGVSDSHVGLISLK